MGLVELTSWDERGLATAHRAIPCPRRRNKTFLVAALFQIHVESLPSLIGMKKGGNQRLFRLYGLG